MLIVTYPCNPPAPCRAPSPPSSAAPPTLAPRQDRGVDGPLCPECGDELIHQTHSGNADYYACLTCGHLQ
jgi:predicted RNA-binding Zn-ribbon protein involved in translation (DUF1610 family)